MAFDLSDIERDYLISKLLKNCKTDGECLVWTGYVGPTGYGVIGFKNKVIRAHRAAYRAIMGAIPDGLHVLHTCDRRACIWPAHLFLGTHADNMADMARKGRANPKPAIKAAMTAKRPRGEAHHASKCDEATVLAIRAARRSGATYDGLSDWFGMPLATVQNIATGATWKHVPGAVPKKFNRRKTA